MIDPKLVENWDIVFALAEKGCGYFATYEAIVLVPRPCTGGSSPYWFLASPCPDGCTSSPPSELPTNPPCDPNYPDNGTENDIIGCCEGIVQVECTGTCCLCGGVACEPSETCCDNVCVDLKTDHDHCGDCNIACEPSEKCCSCTEEQCNATINWTWVPSPECPATTENPYPLGGEWITSDNCPSGCTGKVSPGLPMDVCGPSSATQQCVCTLGATSTCVDITTNENCGDCGVVCSGDKPLCCNGVCCASNNCCSVNGIDTCVDTQTNHDHCSSCNIACEPSETCCSGDCIDTQTDNEHCGSCPNACPVAFTCCAGVCKELFGDDTLNCGDCGKSCAVGEVCKNGVCKDACAANDCSFTWNTLPGCCSTYVCTIENGAFEYRLQSKLPSATDCSQGDSSLPCDGDPSNYLHTYSTWSPEPCTLGCCTHWNCTRNEDDTFQYQVTQSYPSATNCTSGNSLIECNSTPENYNNFYDTWSPDPCPAAFHMLSSDQDEGTLSALAGSWNATATCPQGCNCPGNAPIENGTVDGQVVSYECVNCLAPCGEGQKCCSGTCKNILTDTKNCGNCGVDCGSAAGDTCCNGKCVNTLTSELYCGNCNTVCALSETCCNGFCKNTQTDPSNCGSCGHPCAAGEDCCNGICVNTNTDRNNCGSCPFVCPNADQCIDGICVPCNPPCLEAGTACCNNQCIDILSDENNCGGCGIPCAGKCCGGSCVLDLNTMYNCGDCGIECPQMINQINLWQCCNGVCRNLKTDPYNCGECGLTCLEPPGDTFTVPKCFLGHCAEPECQCQGYEQGMPPQPGPHDVAFVASCVGNTVSCDGPCYFDAVGGGWSLHEETGYSAFYGTCGHEPDYTFCADDRISCVDDKYACVGDIYFCVNNIEGQDMATYCIPKASFNPETQAKIGEYIGTENCTAGCSGDGSVCDPACANGLTCCKTECVDKQTDKNNCGECGNKCTDGKSCKNGMCADCPSPCAEDETCCEGGTTCCKVCCNDGCCADSDFCGEGGACTACECTVPGTTCCGPNCCDPGLICCGEAPNQSCCTADQYCDGTGHCASCQTPVCTPEQKCCSGSCIDNPCGDCPNSCPEGIVCCDEKCCTEGQECCNNKCTDVGTETNCSGCGDACSATEKCCDGSCIDVMADVDNCGGCGVVCPEQTPLCCDGVPTANGTNDNCLSCGDSADPDNPTTPTSCCPSTTPVAGSPDTSTFVITNTNTDDNNCGGCGNVADTSDQVQEKCCKGEIVSLLTDPDNCGSCGNKVLDGKLCCPEYPEPDQYGDVGKPTAKIIDPETDNNNCGSCGNKCNTPTAMLSPGEDENGDPLPPVSTPTDGGTDCPEPGDEPFTKCKDGDCVPCGTCKLPTEQQQSQLLGTPPVYWNQRTRIPCTYDSCGSVSSSGGEVTAKSCYGGCSYKAIGNVGALQWELISCECYDSCNFPGCSGTFAEAFGFPCPSKGICSSGEGPCAGCVYEDFENPIKYICPAPFGMGGSCSPDWRNEITGEASYNCCNHEHPEGVYCNGGCPDVHEDGSQHFPPCTPCGGSCSTGLTCCGTFPNDVCVNLKTDENHCGSCPNICLAGQTCCDGSCKYLDNDNDNCGECANKCTGDWECCGGECKDINGEDSNNCGSCGNSCTTGECCNAGECKEVDLQNDENNCGSCANKCSNGQTCCLGECKDLQTDELNCGFCDHTCAEGEYCLTGICSECNPLCVFPLICCGQLNSCVESNESNCGTCGNACAAGEQCCNGNCKAVETDEANCGSCENACGTGETCCSGICKTLQTDEANCGSCGNACGTGETCCSGICKTLQTDESNCGTCGNACSSEETCCSGICVKICGTCGVTCAAGEKCCETIVPGEESIYECKAVQADESNCGDCGIVCDAGETCCSGVCKDLQTSASNCGTCGYSCSAGEACEEGICILPPLTIKLVFRAFACASDFSNLASEFSAGSRSVNFTITSGSTTFASGSVSNIGPGGVAATLASITIPIGTSFNINISGYAGPGLITSTRASGQMTYTGGIKTADNNAC